ncbi:toxin A [[Clostridium] sordellii ATCC 9714]|nr:TcdA/TcdB catalytic glycosyltransferase domain-containing protein [Paeniclostridium sordellii]EPZ61153.1 toxin A [[Clostridium] sordellii ATCC 9714] [Paeniclostridium sordellii ATCC 9714]
MISKKGSYLTNLVIEQVKNRYQFLNQHLIIIDFNDNLKGNIELEYVPHINTLNSAFFIQS